METYILLGICLAAWIVTVVLFKFLMKHSEHSFVVGSLCGLLVAVAVIGVYLNHLGNCRTCV